MTFSDKFLCMDAPVLADQQVLTFKVGLCGHWMQSRGSVRRNGWYGRMERERERERVGESQVTQYYQHELMKMMMICQQFFRKRNIVVFQLGCSGLEIDKITLMSKKDFFEMVLRHKTSFIANFRALKLKMTLFFLGLLPFCFIFGKKHFLICFDIDRWLIFQKVFMVSYRFCCIVIFIIFR